MLLKCCLVALLLVYVVGLRGSLSELISLQQPAKSRHPDCSVVHTGAHGQMEADRHAASHVDVDAHVLLV